MTQKSVSSSFLVGEIDRAVEIILEKGQSRGEESRGMGEVLLLFKASSFLFETILLPHLSLLNTHDPSRMKQ